MYGILNIYWLNIYLTYEEKALIKSKLEIVSMDNGHS